MSKISNLLHVIQPYQTLTAGVVGFVGVMATLWWNARLQRKQGERREYREAVALKTALIEELKQQREALQVTAASLAEDAASQRDSGTNGPRRGSVIPLERFDAVFRASYEKLGLLARRELAAVFEAYFPLPRLTWRLRRLAEIDREVTDLGLVSTAEHVWLSSKHSETASKMHAQLVPAIDVAIHELEKGRDRRWWYWTRPQ